MYKRHLFRLGVGAAAEVKMSEQGWRDFLTAQNDSDWAVPHAGATAAGLRERFGPCAAREYLSHRNL